MERAQTLSGKLIELLAGQFGWNPNLDLTAKQYLAGNIAFAKLTNGEPLDLEQQTDAAIYIKGTGCNLTNESER